MPIQVRFGHISHKDGTNYRLILSAPESDILLTHAEALHCTPEELLQEAIQTIFQEAH